MSSGLTIVGNTQSKIDELTLKKCHKLCNGFAAERMSEFLEEIQESLHHDDFDAAVDDIKDNSEAVKVIGRILATAYSKGYCDAVENKDVTKLIF